MKRIIVVIAAALFGIQMICAQNSTRAKYEKKFQEKKAAIDKIAGASLSTVSGSNLGYTFHEPYLGIFVEDAVLTKVSNLAEQSFSKGDTFYITQVTNGSFNSVIQLKDSDEYYVALFDAEALLEKKEEYKQKIEELKSLDIRYIMPLWGLTYCGDFDDDGEDYKQEKWYINTDHYNLYFKFRREGEDYTFIVDFGLSTDNNGNGLADVIGCPKENESYIELKFADESILKKFHTGYTDCTNINMQLTKEERQLFDQPLSTMTIYTKEKTLDTTIKSKVQADVLSLKCQCVD